MFTFRGIAQTRDAGRDRCRIRVNAASGFAFDSTCLSCQTRVSIPQEETEYRSDGTNRVIRPARHGLARVSVLRGDGPKEGIPFIDDHIHTSEVIVDYLTEFSGIKCMFPFTSLRVVDQSPRSRRFGSTLVKAHVDATQACVQEAPIARRSRMHIHRPWALQGLSDHQSVPCFYLGFQSSP